MGARRLDRVRRARSATVLVHRASRCRRSEKEGAATGNTYMICAARAERSWFWTLRPAGPAFKALDADWGASIARGAAGENAKWPTQVGEEGEVDDSQNFACGRVPAEPFGCSFRAR